jgi:hypothetical protein
VPERDFEEVPEQAMSYSGSDPGASGLLAQVLSLVFQENWICLMTNPASLD